MRFILMLGLCFLCLACDTKAKLDRTLDNADRTITKANMKLDELSELAKDLKEDLSAAVKMTGQAASKTISDLGDAAGNLPTSGGVVKEADMSADLDEDGTPDSVTAVEYGEEGKYLWLVEASTLEAFACKTQLYLVTDNPPEEIFAWGLVAEGCGVSACDPAEIEKEEPDLTKCECQDPEGSPIECAELYAALAGNSSAGGAGSGGGDDECPEGSEGTPPDCSPIDDGSGGTGGSDPGGGEVSALTCADGSGSVPFEQVCDGSSECADDSDEACNVVWVCASGEAAPTSFVCDGESDCSDSSDEQACSDADWVCDSGDESTQTAFLCDGENDCSDGSDEASCNVVWLCDGGDEIIAAAGVCDGAEDCGDGSDEARCE